MLCNFQCSGYLGAPETTLGFNNSQEGFIELRKAVKLSVTVSYNERIQINMSNRRMHIEQSPEDIRHKLPAKLYR
jgi:hypothetical protein